MVLHTPSADRTGYMILSDRLISRSCRALSQMIGVRLPGGGAYRAASEGDGDRGLPPRLSACPALLFYFPFDVIAPQHMRCRGVFLRSLDHMRRPHEA